MPYTLFKKNIKAASRVLTKLFNKFFNGLAFPKDWSNTLFITFWKGKGDKSDLSNRRPIALLNTIMKLYSKVLASRLGSTERNLIHPNQNGFVPGRSIFVNVTNLQEVIRIAQINDTENAFCLALDLEKAYDRIMRQSIEDVMIHYQFPPKFRATINAIIGSTMARVQVNNIISTEFEVKSGVKQGDPLSPLLFNLVMQLLTIEVEANVGITGLEVSEGNHIKIQHFADDTVIFGHSRVQLKAAMKSIERFEKATGSKLNPNKSVILAPNGFEYNRTFNIPIANNNAPERYLGFFFNNQGMVNQVDAVATNVISCLKRWKSFNLSLKGRVSSVRAYGLSRLVYLLHLDPLSPPKMKQLQNAINWFLWYPATTMENKTYRSKVNTKRLGQLPILGGMNLPSTKDLALIY